MLQATIINTNLTSQRRTRRRATYPTIPSIHQGLLHHGCDFGVIVACFTWGNDYQQHRSKNMQNLRKADKNASNSVTADGPPRERASLARRSCFMLISPRIFAAWCLINARLTFLKAWFGASKIFDHPKESFRGQEAEKRILLLIDGGIGRYQGIPCCASY